VLPYMGLRSGGQFHDAIVNKLRGSGGLLVLDNAQHLNTVCLDTARGIYDASNVALALVGSDTLYERIYGTGRARRMGELISRVARKPRLARVKAEDVERLADAYGVRNSAHRKLLAEAAAGPGGLRELVRALHLVENLAAEEGPAVGEGDGHVARARIGSRTR
jgi:DNA transposition AAA+ family ATPase